MGGRGDRARERLRDVSGLAMVFPRIIVNFSSMKIDGSALRPIGFA